MEGYLALVLHAHLPYVRHAEHEEFLEENWLFEAITETYIPLFLVMERLIEDGVEFRLTFSLTPTLASMLLDPLLQSRYLRKLERTIELAGKEIERTAQQPAFHPLALMYHKLLLEVREAFVERYQRDLVSAFRRFQELGKIEVIASAGTHGYLPLLAVNESAVRAQIGVGVRHYEQVFGCRPRGFWLPECGYYPGLDKLLANQQIRYTILETHGITRADHRPRYGVYAPILCPSGLAAFGRDPDSSRQVWSSAVGYPGDFDYREFYRDVGHDLDLSYVGPYIHPDRIRTDTGIKYYRITGKDDHKEPYVPEWAERKAAGHAEHFLSERIRQVQELSPGMNRPPLVVAPYDAELFGHWWFEGPRWLDYLIRKIAYDQRVVQLVTLSEYLERWPENQIATPSMSSWGQNGFNEVWLNGENDWIYRHLHMGADVMDDLIAAHPKPEGPVARALNQAGRELLLAQSSDWTFMINSGAMKEYATARTKNHLLRLHRLREMIEGGIIDEATLQRFESQDNIFPEIPVAEKFAESPAPVETEPVAGVSEPLPERLKIVMACPELVPFAKTGGLADMAASLATALAKLGHEVSLIMPAYRSALERATGLADSGIHLHVPLDGVREEAGVLTTKLGPDIPVYLISADRYYDRPSLYGTSAGDYPDNARRFVFFARGVLELLRHLGAPHILHAHDWQAALAIAFLKVQPERYPGLSTARTAFTVHNLGYQGLFSPEAWPLLNLDRGLFTPRHFEFHGKINFLKAGLVFADAITTVSPTYAREIQTPEYGFGLEGVLQERRSHVAGILNGVDYDVWNPQTDRWIAHAYNPADLSGKRACKADLQKAFGLKIDPSVPLIGTVSRLAAQKGFDLIEQAAEELMARDLQFILVGSGDHHYQELFAQLAVRFPGRLSVKIAFDERLAHQLEAGADMFLMPSRYEPSGLNQLYSLKYGTIPIVRATGGLKDSVQEFDGSAGTGFVFEPYEPSALLATIDRALAAYSRKDQWRQLMHNAMAADFSWTHSAQEYVRIFRGDRALPPPSVIL
jgi:1,4-alpha-glucan branching enzyme